MFSFLSLEFVSLLQLRPFDLSFGKNSTIVWTRHDVHLSTQILFGITMVEVLKWVQNTFFDSFFMYQIINRLTKMLKTGLNGSKK